jgi:hypothetical protein
MPALPLTVLPPANRANTQVRPYNRMNTHRRVSTHSITEWRAYMCIPTHSQAARAAKGFLWVRSQTCANTVATRFQPNCSQTTFLAV